MIENVTGWSELVDGKLITAVYKMYDTALLGWSIAILFFVFQVILFIKTRNATLTFITGLFFVSLFAVGQFVKSISVQVMFLTLVLELAGILFVLFFK